MKIGELSESELKARMSAAGVAWRVGPFVIRLRARPQRAIDHVRRFYAQCPVVENAIVDFDVSVRHRSPLRMWVRVEVDGQPRFDWFRAHLTAPAIEWALNLTQFYHPNRFLMLHSAVLERGGKVLIMPGEPGAGKSTLCSALALSGWRFFSDETALLDPRTGQVFPVPRPIGLKERAISVIRNMFPGACLGPTWKGTPKGDLAHLRPPLESFERDLEPAPPRWLVFPRYREGAGARFQPLSKGRSLFRAAQNAFNYSTRGRESFLYLSQVTDACDCFEFEYGDLPRAIEAFDELASQPPGRKAAQVAFLGDDGPSPSRNTAPDLLPSVE